MSEAPETAGKTATDTPAAVVAGRRFHARTTYAVWEITLKCNLACQHCGSRAGEARVDELSTEEALDLVHQMAEVGIAEVTLIGGEAFLRPDWLRIAEEIVRCGMIVTMTTGGLGISRETARRMVDVGFRGVSVSVDGMEATHDALRGVKGSWQSCWRTLAHLREAGMTTLSVNTQVNRRSWPELDDLYARLREAGIHAWQVQFTVPMGNAADHADILLQPYDMLAVFEDLARLAWRCRADGIRLNPGNNVGYYGPYQQLLKAQGFDVPMYYTGCEAGTRTLGIEADGKIKGCPSLPSKPYTGANIRERSLAEIMAYTEPLQFNHVPRYTPESTAHLWGFCASCEFAALCRGGCTWTAHVFMGKRGNNPYCHHRAIELAKRGLRERLVRKMAAPGVPFDHGVFDLIEEPLDAPLPEGTPEWLGMDAKAGMVPLPILSGLPEET
ncbi:MAG: radical SAM protein [Candidatus Sericytochromatia bacterium]|nr:radical SAM protein [Candidatus Tanganyikabacteria bacterium]